MTEARRDDLDTIDRIVVDRLTKARRRERWTGYAGVVVVVVALGIAVINLLAVTTTRELVSGIDEREARRECRSQLSARYDVELVAWLATVTAVPRTVDARTALEPLLKIAKARSRTSTPCHALADLGPPPPTSQP